MRGLILAAGFLASAAPALSDEPYVDDRSNPAALARSLYNAINRQEYGRAFGYFAEPPAADIDAYRKGYENTQSVELLTGIPGEEGAAGSVFYQLPVAIRATQKDGSQNVFAGCYTMRLANPAIQEDSFVPLHIEGGTLAASDAAFEDALPRHCGDGPELPRQDALLARAKQMFATDFASVCDAPANADPARAEPDSHTFSYRTQDDDPNDPERQAHLYRFFCMAGAYNETHVYYFANGDGELAPLQFAEPELDIRYVDEEAREEVDSISITGFMTKAELVNSDFDPQTLAISESSKWRGVGDASSTGKWAFRDGRFRLVLYEVDASYDGEVNPETVIDYDSTP
ncbi:DUF1176 domain-containing protein [Aquamicrobium sp. LC103]|uniref:DUF1176 domain-containing protein n=1 Tax=Aquamicrobium sp. LC103 TaxID=1120658 RepID=UPI00063E74F9|nr:DUF1176 domain-containing protein [Aquamicrobium sp. LC103]TKT76926.1 DUF1176 domain-containing protein [Aquamicrobium sp. LC103]